MFLSWFIGWSICEPGLKLWEKGLWLISPCYISCVALCSLEEMLTAVCEMQRNKV